MVGFFPREISYCHDHQHQDHRQPDEVRRADGRHLRVVLPPHDPPLVEQPDQQHGQQDREATPGLAVDGGFAGVHRHERDQQHLDEHVGPRPTVVAAVQVVVQRPVQPRVPDEGEEDDEAADAGAVGMQRQGTGDLGHEHDEDEVVEQLEEADGPMLDHLAVRSRRTHPLAQREPQPGGTTRRHRAIVLTVQTPTGLVGTGSGTFGVRYRGALDSCRVWGPGADGRYA